MQETGHYKLKKPAETDFYSIADQNENADKLDAALDGLEMGKEALVKNAAEKSTPVDADGLILVDNADSKTKRVSWSVIKTTLKTWLDTLYSTVGHSHTKSQITDFPTTMVPSAHASTHKTGKTDALTPGDIGAEVAGAAAAVNTNLQNQINVTQSLIADMKDGTRAGSLQKQINDQALDITAKSAIAAKTVYDTAAKVLRTIKSGIGTFKPVAISLQANPEGTTYSQLNAYKTTEEYGRGPLLRIGDKLYLACLRRQYVSSSTYNYFVKVFVLDANTLQLIKVLTEYSANGATYVPYFGGTQLICPLGAGICWSSADNVLYSLYDLVNDKLASMSSEQLYFMTDRYWGVAKVSSYTSRNLYFGLRNTGTPYTFTLSLGSGTSSSYYGILFLGQYGNTIWAVERTGDSTSTLMKIVLADTVAGSTVTRGVATYSSNFFDALLVGERYVIGYTYTGTTRGWYKFDLVTGTATFGTMTAANLTLLKFLSVRYYVGSVGSTMYFMCEGIVTEFNWSTMTVQAQYDVPVELINLVSSQNFSSYRNIYRETNFSDGIILIGKYAWDTRTNTARQLTGSPTMSTVSGFDTLTAYYVASKIVHDGGTVAKSKTVGLTGNIRSTEANLYLEFATDMSDAITTVETYTGV